MRLGTRTGTLSLPFQQHRFMSNYTGCRSAPVGSAAPHVSMLATALQLGNTDGNACHKTSALLREGKFPLSWEMKPALASSWQNCKKIQFKKWSPSNWSFRKPTGVLLLWRWSRTLLFKFDQLQAILIPYGLAPQPKSSQYHPLQPKVQPKHFCP